MKIIAQVLDGTYGKSAAGIRASLERATTDGWAEVAKTETGSDGCIADWDDISLEQGVYRMIFDSDGYFAGLGSATAYPEVPVIFRVPNELHGCRVQVVLSPYCYSTYFLGTA
jgi:5-hydroxyisourate hydrolase